MKRNPSYFFLLLICWLMPFGHSSLFSQSAAEDFFKQGAYDEALAEWYAMVESGNTSAALYFNIGLAESGLNHVGKSLLAFEQALRIKPGNRAIRKAIVSEREKIINATIPVNPFFLKEWYRQLVMLFRPGVWAIFALVLLVALVVRFLIFQRREPGNWLSHLKSIRIWIVGAFLLLMLSLLSHTELHRKGEAIIGLSCTFHQAPSEESPIISEIGEGEKVVITDQIGAWRNVYLLNQDAGWVRSECLLPINIGK